MRVLPQKKVSRFESLCQNMCHNKMKYKGFADYHAAACSYYFVTQTKNDIDSSLLEKTEHDCRFNQFLPCFWKYNGNNSVQHHTSCCSLQQKICLSLIEVRQYLSVKVTSK